MAKMRSIPASAGEPPAGYGTARRRQVYPRECGGTSYSSEDDALGEGLSPRVRGNRKLSATPRLAPGSIPASAGEPGSEWNSHNPQPVYPRECGGTASADPREAERNGLSPRVRGNHGRRWQRQAQRRSIPASAGEPLCAGSSQLRRPVYPRECGGTSPAANGRASMVGLSPRVRGNRCRSGCWRRRRRSIPASAGEPSVPRQEH